MLIKFAWKFQEREWKALNVDFENFFVDPKLFMMQSVQIS